MSEKSASVSSSGTTTDEIDVAGIELYRATLTLGAKNRGTAFTPEQSRGLITLLDRLASITSSQTDSSLRAAEPTTPVWPDLWCEACREYVRVTDDPTTSECGIGGAPRDLCCTACACVLASYLPSSPTVTPPQTPTELIGENELEMIARRVQGEIDVGIRLVGIGANRTILKLIDVIRKLSAARSTPTEEKTA